MSVMGSEVNRLLKKIKDGDLTKREELFKITAGHLLGVARRYLYHAEDAEDVVAETFVRAFRYIHAYDEVGKSKSLVAKRLKIILKEFFKIIEKEWKND